MATLTSAFRVRETGLRPDDLVRLIPAAGETAFLDSALARQGDGRFSVLGLQPRRVVDFRSGELGDPFAMLDRLEAELPPPERVVAGFPLGPMAIGWLSYDLGRHVERMPRIAKDDLGLPLLRMAVFDKLLVADREEGRTWAVAPADDQEWWCGWQSAAPIVPTGVLAGPPSSNFTRAGFEAAVARCLAYIRAGDIYQVNLSQRFVADLRAAPLEVYARLRALNPAPYAAFLRWRDGAVLSCSPELFLAREGGLVRTRPIKGTRPRGATPEVDAALARELLASPKERAELAMIVDLLRNDLGRVAVPGTVRVAEPRRLETYPGVHHTTATVEAALPEECGARQLLRATFPGGSITGAPKVRAMEIIEELEPVRRGPYTGAIGWLAGGGRLAFNIAIRTVVASRGRLHWHVGAGIVAESDPAAEYEETLVKAAKIAEALPRRL